MGLRPAVLWKVFWSSNWYRGWDEHMYKSLAEGRVPARYSYVDRYRLAHEWWLFYEGFDEEHYYGYLPPIHRYRPRMLVPGGLILVASQSPWSGEWHLVGFYGGARVTEEISVGRKILESVPRHRREELASIKTYVQAPKRASAPLPKPMPLPRSLFRFRFYRYLGGEEALELLDRAAEFAENQGDEEAPLGREEVLARLRRAREMLVAIMGRSDAQIRAEPSAGKAWSRPRGPPCACDVLLEGFAWVDLASTGPEDLPDRPGACVVRVAERGGPLRAATRMIRGFLGAAGWRTLDRYVDSMLGRLDRLEECPLIYIGSADSLRSRFQDLASPRHTAFLPILALLQAGWKLDYGFKTTGTREQASRLEERLKGGCRRIHGGLPALVEG